MPISIGERTLATAAPTDLGAKLLEATGCSPAEAQRWLQGNPMPAPVARALMPFLTGDELPSLAELAEDIAAAGTASVAAKVATLYAAVAKPEAAAPPTEGEHVG